MGLIADTFQPLIRNRPQPVFSTPTFTSSLTDFNRPRMYTANEIVYACVKMLGTSAAEPHIIGRKWQRESPIIRAEIVNLRAKGLPVAQVNAMLIKNGFVKEINSHPLVRLLNKPNPFMSRGRLWRFIVMDLCLAGNAYILKARSSLGNVAELWRLRPDRVRVIPSATNFIEGYEYTIGRDKKEVYPASDIIQFQDPDPYDDYYGTPPLMAIMGRMAIDDYMKGFLKTFFERGGAGVGGVLAVKAGLSQQQKDEVRGVLERRTAGPANWHKTLVLDNTEATYTAMGLNRGLRDALPKELDAVSEARIAMVFGIPGSILGLLIGYESSSYANKRQDWQVFWDLTMTPLLSDLDDVLNLSIVPDYGGIDEVAFDLSDIRALQEDVDKIHERHRKNWQSTLESFEEARDGMGLDPNPTEGTFLMPANMTPVSIKQLDGTQPLPAPAPIPQLPPPTEPMTALAIVDEVHCPNCGRWVGRNLNVGGTAFCPKCKEIPVG